MFSNLLFHFINKYILIDVIQISKHFILLYQFLRSVHQMKCLFLFTKLVNFFTMYPNIGRDMLYYGFKRYIYLLINKQNQIAKKHMYYVRKGEDSVGFSNGI